jgi:hypothetical protein
MMSSPVLLPAASSPEPLLIRIYRRVFVIFRSPEKIRVGAAANGIGQAYPALLSNYDTANVSYQQP